MSQFVHAWRIRAKVSDSFAKPFQQLRGYTHYRTSGEMAALKPPSDPKNFLSSPDWPEIVDISRRGQLLTKRKNHYKEIENLPTPHHKQFLFNVERGKGLVWRAEKVGAHSLKNFQYVTRTSHEYVERGSLQECSEVDADTVSLVEEAIVSQHALSCNLSPDEKNFRIVRAILNILRDTDTYYLRKPRVEVFWQHHEFGARREGLASYLEFAEQPDMLLTADHPLESVVELNDPLVSREDFPLYNYAPKDIGWTQRREHLVSTPGYWFEANQFPVVSVNLLQKVHPNDPMSFIENITQGQKDDRVAAHSLLLNFAMAAGTAYNCGFSLFHEITKPFVSQHIVTDGKCWYLSKYQLNTLAFGVDYERSRQNLCWNTGKMYLFDSVKDNKVHGLDAQILGVIRNVLQAPRRETITDLMPYINLDGEKKFLERGQRLFKHCASRRFRIGEHMEHEVPLWVKIYKKNKDAGPTPLLKWERQRFPHMFQYNEKLYQESIQEKIQQRRAKNLERLYEGLHLDHKNSK